ncbi:unnamed protein product, partial [marine sediment metagenome]
AVDNERRHVDSRGLVPVPPLRRAPLPPKESE